ncbi:hypothetical protein [Baaleninema simplex]|uniref:hypothetical protein n=1 Tax=Baaleninema simplex TaxID=2862350 RepID=UPI0003486816|nr:hypothetical protein [Baaleninema simplex]
MAPNPQIIDAVEQLNYRATVGDVASQAGLEVNFAQQGLLALASDVGGHLQVAETGDIVYQFPKNLRAVLRNKFFRLRLQAWWEKIWRVLFYLIRISFGTLLILSIVLIFVTIAVLAFAASSSRDGDGGGGGSSDRGGGGGGWLFVPRFWIWDWFWFYDPAAYRSQRTTQRTKPSKRSEKDSDLNFLEAVFSFLFGDGNPNADLEERRWQDIATVVRNHRGVVVAEQIAPYLDDLGSQFDRETEDYMLPVLAKFDGYPEVSPEGQLVYRFPELQVTAKERSPQSVEPYLQERPWQFSRASSGQILLSTGLGALNIIGALMLGSLLQDRALVAELGGLVAFVASIYGILLAYGTAFLAVPLIRYFWIQWRNGRIGDRNEDRKARALAFDRAKPQLQPKLDYARQFAAETAVSQEDLAYTTEKDLLQQEFEQSDKIDEEWRKRLESGS